MDLIISGISGKMGQQLLSHFSASDHHQIVAGVDKSLPQKEYPFPIVSRWDQIPVNGDVVIDFTLPDGTEKALEFCLRNQRKLITGTTGLSDQMIQKLKEAGNQITVVHANNFSIGVNLLFDFVRYISHKLHHLDFDVELLETHHRGKKDAPSGTARTLLEVIQNQYQNPELKQVYGREGQNLDRKNQIGVHSLRGGTVIGTHEIRFLGPSENISIKHEAISRHVFVEGVSFCLDQISATSSGYFTMQDLLHI